MTPNEIIKAMDRLAESNSDLYSVERNACREAASLILEMREMLRNAQWQQITSYTPTCETCGGKPQHGHAPDCKLAQMLKD